MPRKGDWEWQFDHETVAKSVIDGAIGRRPGDVTTDTDLNDQRNRKVCFAAGTRFWTAQGYRPIEEIRSGDYVYARDENDPNGVIEEKLVEELFQATSDIWELQVRGHVIRTTDLHPFYVVERGWVACHELNVGDSLLCDDGSYAQVERVEQRDEIETVYNIRVAEYRTYFVGDDDWGFGVWSHNECFHHYTDGAGLVQILLDNMIKANKVNGKVYATKETLNPVDAWITIFIGLDRKQNHGDYMVIFDTKPGIIFTPNPLKSYEYTHVGSLRFVRHATVIYAGPNFYQ
jgi:hypothetical protein